MNKTANRPTMPWSASPALARTVEESRLDPRANPESGTTELDESFLELTTYQGREFQNYSLENSIYFGPVDDVIGVDISPHMKPDDTPENLWLQCNQVDDLNRTFTFPPNHFDLVHSRLIASGLHRQRWPRYIRDIKRTLRPGGWVQMAEMYFNVQSDNGTITNDHALRQWSSRYARSIEDVKDPRVAMNLGNLLTSAGFVNVETKLINIPLAAWSNDPRMREIGSLNRLNVYRLFGSLALYPLMKRLHMSREEFEVLVAQARIEVDNLSLKAYFPLYVSIGQKP
ncbi:conserved hypothetical protein [Histoplasma capsulatum G186AR]|uniref:Methyltransferase type 11 domain-containing protein n=1 Tax=Ajellomyces capsulatus (strain G186AR / H82 / ATCC MYA-2454 / RMSCC 2432) TaxID=447093 RepID=C0NLB8_AJECG|nr:uncharacterized protein HCBG_04298 [Histoplasma capsulatum G186AR]EEH07419.1 conserved hypothetical protein [Histoplasma capsulatum G186AR]